MVTIKSRRRLSIRQGDELLLLSRSEGRQAFTAYTSVVTVESPSSERDDRLQTHRVLVDHWLPLEPPVYLDLFIFSLTIVRNLDRPNLHFRSGYRRLPEEDVMSIRKAEPFVARTTYYKLLNALPDGLQSSFLADLLLDTSFANATRFQERARKLITFIDERVVAAGTLIHAMEKTIAQLELNSEDSSFDHVFAEEASPDQNDIPPRFDNLFEQAEAFRELQSTLASPETRPVAVQPKTLFDEILDEMNQPDRRNIEERFEAAFRSIR